MDDGDYYVGYDVYWGYDEHHYGLGVFEEVGDTVDVLHLQIYAHYIVDHQT